MLTFYFQNNINLPSHADKTMKRFSTSGEKNRCVVVQSLDIVWNIIAFSEIISVVISPSLFHRQLPKNCLHRFDNPNWKAVFLFQVKTKQILNNKHMRMVFKLFGVFTQLLLLDSQINEWTSKNAWFVWNKSNKSHSLYISTSVSQPGFRWTSRFWELLPGVPPKHRNKTMMPYFYSFALLKEVGQTLESLQRFPTQTFVEGSAAAKDSKTLI